jgi:hypothetical protein
VLDVAVFDHLAVLVRDLDADMAMYRDVYQVEVSPAERHERCGLSSAFVDLGYTRLRLMQPEADRLPASGGRKRPASQARREVGAALTGSILPRYRMCMHTNLLQKGWYFTSPK